MPDENLAFFFEVIRYIRLVLAGFGDNPAW